MIIWLDQRRGSQRAGKAGTLQDGGTWSFYERLLPVHWLMCLKAESLDWCPKKMQLSTICWREKSNDENPWQWRREQMEMVGSNQVSSSREKSRLSISPVLGCGAEWRHAMLVTPWRQTLGNGIKHCPALPPLLPSLFFLECSHCLQCHPTPICPSGPIKHWHPHEVVGIYVPDFKPQTLPQILLNNKDFFQLAKEGTNPDLLWKQSDVTWTFRKWGIPVWKPLKYTKRTWALLIIRED